MSLREQFGRAVAARPATPHLVTYARRAGIRLRRRRRIEAAVASAVAVALTGVAISAAAGAGGSAALPAAAPGDVPAGPTAYALTSASVVVPIRLGTGTVIRPVRPPGRALAMAADPGGKAVFVFSATSHASFLTRINAATGAAASPVRMRGGLELQDIAQVQVTPGGRTALVNEFGISAGQNPGGGYELVSVNLSTGAGRMLLTDGSSPFAITPDGRTAYVTGNLGNTVTRLDLATGTVLSPVRLSVPDSAFDIAMSPGGRTGYVTSVTRGAPTNPVTWVTPVDVSTGVAARSIGALAGYGTDIAIAPDGATAYLSGRQYVTPVSLSTGKAFSPIRLAPDFVQHIAIFELSPTGKIGYAQRLGGSLVQPVNLVSGTALRPVSLPPGHGTVDAVAFGPGGNIAYVGVSGRSGEVIPVHTATQRAGQPIAVDGAPQQIVIAG
jgi:hypothetical protein